MSYELFHAIGDAGSAQVRKLVVAHQLGSRIRFRNVVYPEVKADLEARGGKSLPALWDGTQLVSGVQAVSEALLALAQPTAKGE